MACSRFSSIARTCSSGCEWRRIRCSANCWSPARRAHQPAVAPLRRGLRNPDAPGSAFADRLSIVYVPPDGLPANAEVITYWHRIDSDGVPQLMRYDGQQSDLPVADHIAGLHVAYFDGGGQPLAIGSLSDGPWLPHAVSPQRFDADLLAVRKVRVTLRVQPVPSAAERPADLRRCHDRRRPAQSQPLMNRARQSLRRRARRLTVDCADHARLAVRARFVVVVGDGYGSSYRLELRGEPRGRICGRWSARDCRAGAALRFRTGMTCSMAAPGRCSSTGLRQEAASCAMGAASTLRMPRAGLTGNRGPGAQTTRDWQLFAYGPLGGAYVIVWAGDDPAETDGDPGRDDVQGNPGAGIVALRAEAFGADRAHTVLEATARRSIAASGVTTLEMLSWQHIR